MKLFLLSLSTIGIITVCFFMIANLGGVYGMGEWIMFSLLSTLLSMCVVGVMLNYQFAEKKVSLIYKRIAE